MYSHIIELRKRTIYVLFVFAVFFTLAFVFRIECIDFIFFPMKAILQAKGITDKLVITDIKEGFVTSIKLSAVIGFVLDIPFILLQVYKFTVPALWPKEKKAFLLFAIGSLMLFIIGIVFAYCIAMSPAFYFLLHIAGNTIEYIPKLSEYVTFFLDLCMGFGICFQLPLILLILVYLGAVNVIQLKQFRRFAVLMIFIIAAVFTPPDVVSQFMLALPLVLLYEIAIILGRLVETND